jgi:DNA-binding IclR family transcriptional regulator
MRNPNIASVATPIHSAGGTLLGALAVSGLTTRFTEDRRSDALTLLERHAAALRLQMGQEDGLNRL